MKPWMRYVPPVLLIAILFTAIILNDHDVINGLAAWFAFAFVATLPFLVCHCAYFIMEVFQSYRGRENEGPDWKRKLRKTAHDLHEQIASGGCDLVSLEQAQLFAAVTVDAGNIQRRIVEEYEPVRHALRKKVTIDVEIPDAALRQLERNEDNADETAENRDGYLLIPVAVSTQGVPYDDLRVYGASENEKIPTLNDPEYMQVAACVLHKLLSSDRSPQSAGLLQEAKDVEVDAIRDIICHISVEGEIRHGGRETADKLRDLAKRSDVKSKEIPDVATSALKGWIHHRIKGKVRKSKVRDRVKTSDVKSSKTLLLAADIVDILTSRRFKVVRIPVPASGRFTFKYECILAPRVKPGKSWRPKFKGFVTLRWKTLKIWLNNASFCQSYHAIVRSSDNLYLFRQQVSPEGYMDIRLSGNLNAPYIRFRHLFGQSYANFYGRNLQAQNIQPHVNNSVPHDEIPVLVVDFAEVPPGSLFIAAVAAATSAVLVWVAAIAVKHHDPASSIPIPTDLPVLILAFPGVAAAWLGFDSTDSKLFEGSLLARLSLFLTAVISLLAAVLYIGFSKTSEYPRQGQLMTLGIADRWWWGLTVAAIANAVVLCYLWLLNWWRYRHFQGNVVSAEDRRQTAI